MSIPEDNTTLQNPISLRPFSSSPSKSHHLHETLSPSTSQRESYPTGRNASVGTHSHSFPSHSHRAEQRSNPLSPPKRREAGPSTSTSRDTYSLLSNSGRSQALGNESRTLRSSVADSSVRSRSRRTVGFSNASGEGRASRTRSYGEGGRGSLQLTDHNWREEDKLLTGGRDFCGSNFHPKLTSTLTASKGLDVEEGGGGRGRGGGRRRGSLVSAWREGRELMVADLSGDSLESEDDIGFSDEV